MLSGLLKEILIIAGGTLFFVLLCATVGISTSTPPSRPNAETANQTRVVPPRTLDRCLSEHPRDNDDRAVHPVRARSGFREFAGVGSD